MAYLSFWLVGFLRCFDGSGHPFRLLTALSPLAVSVWIGITRLQVSNQDTQACVETPLPGKALAIRTSSCLFWPSSSSRFPKDLAQACSD